MHPSRYSSGHTSVRRSCIQVLFLCLIPRWGVGGELSTTRPVSVSFSGTVELTGWWVTIVGTCLRIHFPFPNLKSSRK
ncbi:hypothetical protein EV361DRAFT_220598 [Lentinula raphanica]|nr:hypothetical protein EV361DRAFT_220598 [Lentinula raphanica]